MKTILYATDYSDNSIAALKYSHALSEKIKAQLVIIHIYHIPVSLGAEFVDPSVFIESNYYEENQSRLQEFVHQNIETKANNERISVEAIQNFSVLHGILSKAKELDPFLIITGMKGKSAIAKILMGNTTKELIEKASYPILAIPEGVEKIKIKTMVYASDFEEEDLEVLQTMIEIAHFFKAKIHIVHFTLKDEASANQRMEWFKDMLNQKVTYSKLEFVEVMSQNIYESLQNYIADKNADILGMLERKKSGFLEYLFHRDLVKKMASRGKTPLLSFNEKNYTLKNELIS